MSRFPEPPNAIAAVSHADPYPYYARLVADEPFFYDDSIAAWVVTSADFVTAVLESDRCTVRPNAELVPKPLVGSSAGEVFRKFVRMNDDDGREGIKRSLSRAAASLDASVVRAIAEKHALALVDSGCPIADYASRLPNYVIAELLGVPRRELQSVHESVDAFVRCLAPGASALAVEQGKTAARRLALIFQSLFDDLDIDGSESLLAAIKREMLGAKSFENEAAVANGIGFLFQAYDGTAGLIGMSIVTLSAYPQLRAAIFGNRQALQSFVAEVIRYDPPVQNTRRYVARSGEIAGRTVGEGEMIIAVLAAANRDPSANEDPDRFDIARINRRHYTFGLGRHACLGERLATTIASAGVATALRAGFDPRCAHEGLKFRPSPNVRIPVFANVGTSVAGRPVTCVT